MSERRTLVTALKRAVAGCAVFGSALLVPAFAQAACDKPVRFGVTDPLTGPSASYGKDQMQAVRWAVDDINARGGVDGCPLEAIIVDNQGKPETAIGVVSRFIDVEHVPVFITAFSDVVHAVAPIANRQKTLMLSAGANSPGIAKLGDYVFTVSPLADKEMDGLARYLVQQGRKKVAILYVNNDTGKDGAVAFAAAFKADGGTVVLNEAYQADQADFTGLILQVRLANPDEIHIHGVVADTTALLAQLRQLGVTTPVDSYQNAFNPQMVKQIGPPANGLVVSSMAPTADVKPTVADYVKRWIDQAGREPVGLPYTQYFYDAPWLVAQLAHYVRSHDMPETGESYRAALLAQRSFEQPLTGTVMFNPDHTVEKPIYIWDVRDLTFHYVGLAPTR